MRTILSGFMLGLGTAAVVAAQSTTIERRTEIDVKDGEKVKLTGCLERHPDPTGATSFQLTNVTDREGRVSSYLLVDEEDDLEEHIGHLVEIRGKAADKDEGRIRVKTRTKVEREGARDTTTETVEETAGDLSGIPILDVDDVRMIRPTCS